MLVAERGGRQLVAEDGLRSQPLRATGSRKPAAHLRLSRPLFCPSHPLTISGQENDLEHLWHNAGWIECAHHLVDY